MAKIRLTPSTYSLSNTTYMGVTDAANMYNNTDNETYATIEHKRAYNSVYYCYIKGFDFSKIPENATINSFAIKLKASESGNSVSTTYKPVICKGTATYSNISTTQVINTAAKTITFSGSVSWETLKGAGTELGIRIALRRNSTMTTAYVYVYGAEIEVDYDVPSEGGLSVKQGGEWKKVSKVYKKVSGSWVEQEDIESLFDENTKYINGGNV